MSKLEGNKTSVLVTFQGGGGNTAHTCTNNKGRDPNKSYVEGLNNIESWRVHKLKDYISIYGQYWYWRPKHNMVGKFDGIYTNHTCNNHYEWAE